MSKSVYKKFTAELKAVLIRVLVYEWEQIVDGRLGAKGRSLIAKPSICFVKNVPYLGMFRFNDVPVISLNEELVLEHSWCALLSVFYHEVAHQLTFFEYGDVLPHGPEFKKMCSEIGARWEASNDEESLDDVMLAPPGTLSPLGEKLRKLFAMAEGGEPNEAQVALSKARELMARYGLTELDADGSADYVTVQVGSCMKRVGVHVKVCASMLDNYWGVQSVILPLPDPECVNDMLHVISISGTRDKVAVASYVYDCIMRGMGNAYQKQKGSIHGVNGKRSFCLGYMAGIINKLDKDDADGSLHALIHKGDPGTNEYMRRRFHKLSRGRSRSGLMNRDAMNRGFADGRKLEIRPGMAVGVRNNLLTE